jgi:hypothetical protein
MGLIDFFGALGFHKSLQVGEVHLPEAAVLLDPGVDGAKRFRIELVDAVAAFAVLVHQMGAAEKTQVLGNGRAGDGESLSDFSRGLAASAKQIEDSAASGIGKCLKGSFGGICNRTVTHNA